MFGSAQAFAKMNEVVDELGVRMSDAEVNGSAGQVVLDLPVSD